MDLFLMMSKVTSDLSKKMKLYTYIRILFIESMREQIGY